MFATDLFEDRVVLVTGAGRGIGRSIAVRVADLGGDLVVNDIDEETALDTVSAIEERGQRAVASPADVGNIDEVEAMVQMATEELGPVRHVVNNAVAKNYHNLTDISIKEWEEVMRVNLTGAMTVSRTVVNHLLSRGLDGSIANISSLSSFLPQPGSGSYGPSKGALVSLTGLMALEWADQGIRANAICPGLIWTEASAPVYTDDGLREARLEYVPLDRVGTPEDIAQAVVYSLAPENSYLTGETIVVDGGVQLIGNDRFPGKTVRE